MFGRTVARVLLAMLVIGGAIALGVTAYNAGVTAGLAQDGVIAPGTYPVAPYAGYGWGWGPGFGFFGFFGFLLFLFLVFALLRAAFGGPRRGWGPGWGGRGWDRDHGTDPGSRPRWEDRAREIHDEWHRGRGAPGRSSDGDVDTNPAARA
jgi:hypothetical protein